MPYLLILLFLALAAYGQQERIAIINTLDDRDSINISELTYLTDKLREKAVNVLPGQRFDVMTTESIVAFLGSQENTVKVCKEASCLAELGRKVNADYVAQGRLGRFSGNFTLKVELYNVQNGNLMGSFTGKSKDIFSLLGLIDEKAPDLFKNMLEELKTQTPEPSPDTPSAPAPQQVPLTKTANIQKLIENGVKENKEIIQKESLSLSPSDKMALYEKNRKKSIGLWITLNILPGFGLGSYIQGDITFGIIQSVIGVAGWGFTVYEFNKVSKMDKEWNSKYVGVPYSPGSAFEKEMDKKREEIDNEMGYTLLLFIGTVEVIGVVGAIAPVLYKIKYNKTLKEALNMNPKLSYSIDPLIIPRDGTPAVGLALNLRY